MTLLGKYLWKPPVDVTEMHRHVCIHQPICEAGVGRTFGTTLLHLMYYRYFYVCRYQNNSNGDLNVQVQNFLLLSIGLADNQMQNFMSALQISRFRAK